MASGGSRIGAGRKKSEPTKVIRIPEFLVEEVMLLVSRYKQDPNAFVAELNNSKSKKLASLKSKKKGRKK